MHLRTTLLDHWAALVTVLDLIAVPTVMLGLLLDSRNLPAATIHDGLVYSCLAYAIGLTFVIMHHFITRRYQKGSH